MNEWKVKDVDTGDVWHKDSREECEEAMQDFGHAKDLEIIPPGEEDMDVDVVDHTEPDVVEEPEEITENVTETLPDEQPGVDTDPLEWVPSDFVDYIDGTPAINRKGYDVLAQHYGISVTTEVLVSPSETSFEYAEIVATAETEEGIIYKAHGSAHVDRGDDSFLLLEMADTRAAKRATARATGVGMVAVQELQNEL